MNKNIFVNLNLLYHVTLAVWWERDITLLKYIV